MIRGAARWRLALVAGALASGAASGCSLAFVEGPPIDHAARHYFDCTSSNLAPTVDAVLGGLIALGMLGDSNNSDSSQDGKALLEGTGVVFAALASATYGYVKTARCREAKEELSARLLEPPYLPLRLAPPPPDGRADPWLQGGAPPTATWVGAFPPAAPPPPPVPTTPPAVPDAGAPDTAASER